MQIQEQARTGRPQYTFEHNFPTSEAAQSARDDADFQRAVIAYRFWYPTISCEGIMNGARELGTKEGTLALQETAPRHVCFTPNSDTPYGLCILDLKDGPYVIDIPPGAFIGLVNDHHQGWILDMGLPGPAGAKGGKHLVLPPGYKGEAPSGYFHGTSVSNKVMVAIRSLPPEGDVKAAMNGLRAVKIYPLASAANPKPLQVVDVTDRALDASCLRWEDNIQYWQKLYEVIDAEPLVETFLPMYGELAALGIEKGKPFAPDERMTGLLERAARSGRDQMLVSSFSSVRPDRLAWKDRRWEWVGLVPDSAQFETKSGIDLEARDRWFAQAIVTSPAMFRRTPGAGSLYWFSNREVGGGYLDGANAYRLTIPIPVPGKLFWSVTVYDAATRSEIQTAQGKAALRSLFELKALGDVKSVDLYFGPKAPSGQEGRWIQTIPGKGWFSYFRIYGPDGPAFDGSWRPGDFEAVR
jgi:hypothetical protein